MNADWIKNECGMHLHEKQMSNIPRPRMELVTHVTMKTVQSFGLLGTLIVGPATTAHRNQLRDWPVLKENMTRAGKTGVLLGLISGPLLTTMVTWNHDRVQVWDLCYRIRYNRRQIRVDQASLFGAICGAGAAAAMAVEASRANEAVFGGLVGMSSGMLLACLFNYGTMGLGMLFSK